MKKIFSLIMVLVLVLASIGVFTACDDATGDNVPLETRLDLIDEMLNNVTPRQSVTTINQRIGALTLESKTTLITGKINGANATSMLREYQQLAEINPKKLSASLIENVTSKEWYIEGQGYSTDGKTWYESGYNFAPKAGEIDIDLTANASKLTNLSYDAATETLSFSLAQADANVILAKLMDGQKFSSGVTVSISTAGGYVTSIKLQYTEPEYDILIDESKPDDDASYVTIPESVIVVEAIYSYDLAEMTLN